MKKLFVALLFFVASISVVNAEEKRPNILFAFADDWGCLLYTSDAADE